MTERAETAPTVSATDIARRHVESALAEGARHGRSADAMARAILGLVIEVFRRERSPDDVRSELEFAAEHAAEDEDFPFLRP
jgi:hypothetical protein